MKYNDPGSGRYDTFTVPKSINKFIIRVQYGVYKASIKIITPPPKKIGKTYLYYLYLVVSTP